MRDWGYLRIRALECLSDWKDVRELASDLGISVEDARALISTLLRKGLIFHDGHKFICKGGIRA